MVDGAGAENAFGQPVGPPVPGWAARPEPSATVLAGRWCRLERLDPARHADDLAAADAHDVTGASWTYLPYGPFGERAAYDAWMSTVTGRADPFFYAVIDGTAVGVLALMSIRPEIGVIEVGHVHYLSLLARRRAATEAQFLAMRYVFDDLGYRRYEWKCDALNAPSRAAAARLGFRFEGVFRQDRVVKGRNRDTAWYSIVDGEWPAIRAAFERWLAPSNFDDDGRQRHPLRARATSG